MNKRFSNYLILCLTGPFSFLPILALAQTGLYASFNTGADISYNRLVSDKPLPPDPVALRRAGTCLDLGLNYRFHPRFSVEVHAKTASVKRGIIAKDTYVMERDSATGMVISERKDVFNSLRGPLIHFQAGASLYPVVRPRVEWKIGAGIASMFANNSFGVPTGIMLDGEDKLFSALFEEYRLRKAGLLVNINTSISYKVGDRGAFILTLNHNQGLRDIFEQRSLRFFYLDKTTNTSDNYNVRLLNNGSYSSGTIGYRYKIFTKPLDNSRLSAGQPGLYASLSGGINISYNRLVSDKLLPPEPVALNRAGSCRDFGLYYRFHSRFSLDANVKAASIKRGLKAGQLRVFDRDTTGNIAIISVGRRGYEYVSGAPLHIQAGASFYPLVTPRVDWKIGTGLAAMKITNGFTPRIGMQLDANDLYYDVAFETEKKVRKTGWLVNLNTSLSYKVGEKGAFVLTLNQNQSLFEIFEHQSSRYFFLDKRTGVRENYNVRLLNDASYSSCTFGYSYRLLDTGSGRRNKS